MKPTAMVIDRSTAPSIADAMNELGGAWGEMFNVWYRSGSPYLVLLAHTKKRLRLGAPLTYMVIEQAALRSTLQTVFANLHGRECRWCLFIEKGSEAEVIVRRELLADTEVEGHS